MYPVSWILMKNEIVYVFHVEKQYIQSTHIHMYMYIIWYKNSQCLSHKITIIRYYLYKSDNYPLIFLFQKDGYVTHWSQERLKNLKAILTFH